MNLYIKVCVGKERMDFGYMHGREGKGREGKVGMGTEVSIDYRFLFLCIFKID